MIIKKYHNDIIFYDEDNIFDLDKVIHEEVYQSQRSTNIEVINQEKWIKKHYIRKGLMTFLGDKYITPLFGLANTRSYSEFKILNFLHKHNFNTCKPIIGWLNFQNPFIYRASLIVERFEEVITLSDHLQNNADEKLFYNLGQQISSMHKLGVYHGDLNAHNILIETKDVFNINIIDFDKSLIGVNCKLFPGLMSNNLSRLRQSLVKLGYTDHLNKYWDVLMKGYLLDD